LVNVGESRGLYTRRQQLESITMFAVSNTLMQYCMGYESDVMNKQIYKKMKQWGRILPNEHLQIEQWHRSLKDSLTKMQGK